VSLSAQAALALRGSILYAPAALVDVSGKALIDSALVVGRLQLGAIEDRSLTSGGATSPAQEATGTSLAANFNPSLDNPRGPFFMTASALAGGDQAIHQGSSDGVTRKSAHDAALLAALADWSPSQQSSKGQGNLWEGDNGSLEKEPLGIEDGTSELVLQESSVPPHEWK
jgi:hypothetical protein